MTDNTELKRLAELLHGAEWQLVDGDGFDADNRFVTSQCRIDDNKVAFAEINYGHPEAGMGEPFQSEQVAAGEFIAAANPAAVLALIAENERLQSAANTLARIGYTDHGGELWKPPIGQKPNFDQIDQLRAEVAGLKTGYEAYERVNAELKAENEALRNGLRLARHWCTSALKAARVDSQPSELLDIACLLRHQASDIDAALGQGEQS